MQLQLETHNDCLTARPVGELDHHTAGEIRQKIDTALLQHRCRRLVLDLAELTFMDSSGIGLIMGRYRHMQTLGGEMTVVGANPRIRSLMHMAGLDKLPLEEKLKG